MEWQEDGSVSESSGSRRRIAVLTWNGSSIAGGVGVEKECNEVELREGIGLKWRRE